MKQWLVLVALVAVGVSGCGPSAGDLRDRAIREFQTGNLDKAESLLDEALDRDPTMPEGLYYMGRIHQARGFYEQAIYYYQNCLDLDPSYSQSRRWLERAEEESGFTDGSMRFIPVD